MTIKRSLSIALRIFTLTFIYFICFSAAASFTVGQVETESAQVAAAVENPPAAVDAEVPEAQPLPAEQAKQAAVLLLVSALNTAVLAFLILRSRWHGWKLAGIIFIISYGVMTLMSQMESAIFITGMPSGMLPKLLLMGAFTLAPFSILAVWILGKWKADAGADVSIFNREKMSRKAWGIKLAILAVVYAALYFSFGYFVAWQNPELREYYGHGATGSFADVLLSIFQGNGWLYFFQMGRGILWVLLALPVVFMMKGRWQEIGLAVALLFAVIMNSQLLLPNPLMPETVRISHLIETASSNFIFGWIVVWVLVRFNIGKTVHPQPGLEGG